MTSYDRWINGESCCNAHNFLTISGECKTHDDACSCEHMLLEISNLHTDDLVLQEEIDDLSGQVETKLDASAYTPVDLTDYYTKEEVDALIPSGGSVTVDSELSLTSTNPVQNKVITEALNGKLDASAYTPTEQVQSDWNVSDSASTAYIKNKPTIPSLSGYATEEWVETKGYLTEHQPLSGYVKNSTFLQYVTSLQQQIDSLTAAISGCCGESGETQYRWIIETGENDYWCSGTTKMSKEKQQSSTDGINWADTGSERSGSTVLEENCVECGYVPALTGKKYSGVTTANTEGSFDCNCDEEIYDPTCTELVAHELTAVFNPRGVGKMKSVTVGECVNVIGNGCFGGESNLETLILPSTITAIKNILFEGCTSIENLTLLGTIPPVFHPMISGAYAGLFGENETPPANFKIYVPTSAVNTYKAATGWSAYSDIIQGI